MDVPEAEAVENVDNVFLHFIYGFLVLLALSILISLGKAIYHFYKIRRERNVETIDDTIATECHSISDEPLATETQSEVNVPESERLRLQLDKLRRLLNRLNAMGTFSRDTIGDLSTESAVRVNTSKAASSDMSEFWSSIDFDEFEDSTINYGKFGKTPTEKSVSPSISDYSLDTSGIPFDNIRHKNFATSSRENVLNVPSAFNPRTNPSDAMIQILTILDSIMLKNRKCDSLLKNNLKVKKSNECLNSQSLNDPEYLSEPSTSAQKLSLSPNVPKKFCTTESLNSDTIINMPDERQLETQNSDIKVVASIRNINKPVLFEQLSQTDDSKLKVSTAVSMEGKLSKVMSVVNIMSSSRCKHSYATKLSSSSKSLNKISMPQSVSLSVDPFKCISTHAKEISKSVSAAPGYTICKNVQTKARVSEILPCTLDIEAIYRSHSLSDLLDKTLLSIEESIKKSCSYVTELEIPNFTTERKTTTLKSLSDSSGSSEKHYQQNNEILGNEHNIKSTNQINKEMVSSASARNLHSPCLNPATLKLSVSEPEIKQSPFFGMLSPNLSSSGSDAFLSPLVIDISPSEKIYWKSPVQLNSDISVRNLTPHTENAIRSRKSCLWSTPPLPTPKEIITDEIIV